MSPSARFGRVAGDVAAVLATRTLGCASIPTGTEAIATF